MASRFGETVSDDNAYRTARSATRDMTTEQLLAASTEDLGPNQRKALDEELQSR